MGSQKQNRTAVYAAVFVGGGLGAVLRTMLSQQIPFSPDHVISASLLANLIGSAALGFFTARPKLVHPGLTAGFCGGLTTFSALAPEWQQMRAAGVANGFWQQPFVFQIVVCVLAFWLSRVVTERISSRA